MVAIVDAKYTVTKKLIFGKTNINHMYMTSSTIFLHLIMYVARM